MSESTVARTVLAFDLGTGGCKAALVDERGAVLETVFVEYPTRYPNPGWHEQRPADWWRAVVESTLTLTGAARANGIAETTVSAISLSGQSLAFVPCDAELTPLVDAVPIWSDSRAGEQAAAFFERVPEDEWYLKTGNGFPASLYTVFELAWYAQHHPDVIEGARWFLGSKDWINARLTGQIATDPSYASGLGAYDLAGRRYDAGLLAALGVDEVKLPPIVPSHSVIGALTEQVADELGLAPGVRVVAGGVDNSCMSLGAGLDRPNQMYLSLGSSNWLTVSSPAPILDTVQHPYVFDHVIEGLYVSALSTFAGGSSISWLANLFEMKVADMLELADRSAPGSAPIVVPTLGGGTVAEGGPEVRGVIAGLDLGHGRGELARAVVEGVAYSLAGTAALLSEHVPIPEEIVAVGGGARSALLMQTLADVLDRRIVRVPNDQHAAALGAAALALLGIGAWDDLSPLRSQLSPTEVYSPRASRAAANAAARTLFEAAAEFAKATAPLGRALRTR